MPKGRYFNSIDTASSEPVAVVNRVFARFWVPRQQNLSKVLGMKVISLNPHGKSATIIGVLNDFHQTVSTTLPFPRSR
jgi:hypothetical protein